MRKQHLLLAGLVLTLLLSLPACISEIGTVDEDDWNPRIGIPVINTSFGLAQLLEKLETDELVEADGEGFLSIVYRESVAAEPGAGLPALPDIPIPVTEPDQQAPNPSPAPLRLDLARLKAGTLQYTIENPHDEPVALTLTVFSLKRNGQPLVETLTLPANGAGSGSVDLADYLLDFTDGVRTRYVATRISGGAPVDLPAFLLQLRQLDFSYAEGYFGQFAVTVPADSVRFGFLEDWENGALAFAEPGITLNFRHSYGLPLALRADRFDFQTFRGGVLPLMNDEINNGLLLNYPTPAEAGMEKTTTLVLDNSNSNIAAILNNVPFQLDYEFSAFANPADDPSLTNHLTDTSRLAIDLEVEFPLNIRSEGFRFSKATELDFDEELEGAESAEFKLVTDNGFPFTVRMQLYFLDGAGAILDSLYTEGLTPVIAAAAIDADGIATIPTEQISVAEISGDRLEAIRDRIQQVRVTGDLLTPDDGQTYIRIYDDYELTIKLGVLAGF